MPVTVQPTDPAKLVVNTYRGKKPPAKLVGFEPLAALSGGHRVDPDRSHATTSQTLGT
jgi:hypothetical protein